MPTLTRSFATLLAGWLIVTSAGCASLNLAKMDFRSRKATVRNPAVKVVCLWEPAEGRDPKGMPCQGFAGRVLFLNSSSLPVSVDGDVRIYLFDDQGTVEEQSKPIHEFDFKDGSWSLHYSYGTLGPAYNVFVPYTRKKVHDATCALRLRLQPKEGPAIFSELTSIELLSFQGGKGAFKGSQPDRRVEETIPEDLTSVNNRRKTTTISLNPTKDPGPPGQNLPNPIFNRDLNSQQNQILQAAYQEDDHVKPLSDADARIAQLEQMVKELKALQATNPVPPRQEPAPLKVQVPAAPAVSASPKVSTPPNPPRRLEEIEDDQVRFKVRSAPGAPELSGAQQQSPIVNPSKSVSGTKAGARADSSLRAHPLDDESSPPATSAPRHPLSEFLDRPTTIGSKAPRQRARSERHPLEDDPEPIEQTGRRKTIKASEPQIIPARSESADPFDPIDTDADTDTDAIETTAVDDLPTVRRQLRSARR